MRNKNNYKIRSLIFLFLALAVLLPVRGQQELPMADEPDNAYSIDYAGQFPLPGDSIRESGTTRLFNFIFGKEEKDILKPVSVKAGSREDIWVLDQGSGRVFRSSEETHEKLSFRKPFREPFPSLVDACLLPDGAFVFSDSKLNSVFIYTPGDKTLMLLNDSLSRPTGLACSADGKEIWVAETGAHRLAVINREGKVLRRIGSQGSGPGEFNFPTHLCVDACGEVLVVDAMNLRVQIFDSNGHFLSMFGEAGNSSGFFSRPKGIARDSYGHIYVADALFHVVQVFDRSGRYLSSFGSRGTEEEQLWMPMGIYIDGDNYIYVADTYNRRIQIFQLKVE